MSNLFSVKTSNRSEKNSKAWEFEEEALTHTDELYSKALQYTKNEKDSEDLVQKTLTKAYENWDRYETGTNCRAWLFTILRNTFINNYRSQKREREILNSDDNRAVKKYLFNQKGTEYYENPEKEKMNKTFSQDLHESLKTLSEEFRRVVVLADLNDFSYKEIAYILDCPVGTVMSRLFRGRKLMRQQLVDAAYERGIIRDPEPFRHEDTNRTRESVRERKMENRKEDKENSNAA